MPKRILKGSRDYSAIKPGVKTLIHSLTRAGEALTRLQEHYIDTNAYQNRVAPEGLNPEAFLILGNFHYEPRDTTEGELNYFTAFGSGGEKEIALMFTMLVKQTPMFGAALAAALFTALNITDKNIRAHIINKLGEHEEAVLKGQEVKTSARKTSADSF